MCEACAGSASSEKLEKGESVQTLNRLEGVRFVMWGFPEPTQTFIHREFQEMVRQGLRVQILAGAKRDMSVQPEDIQEIVKNDTIYLGNPVVWFLKGLLVGTFSGLPFWRVLCRMMKFKHKDFAHKMRAMAMTVAAASVAHKVKASGTRHLQAHFGSYQTELAMALAWMIKCTYGGTWHAVDIWKDANILPDKIRHSEVVFTCTKYNADHLVDVAGDVADKVRLSYHGLDFSRLPVPAEFAPLPCDGVREAMPEVIAIGRLVPKKGFNFLIDAVAKLAREKFPVHLTIVGDGPLESALKNQVEDLNLQERVTFTGSLKNTETLNCVNKAHLLAAPSIQDKDGNIDGIPNVTLEAMALARPVIGTKLSGIPEVVNDNTGALVDCADVDGLAEAMKRLLSDREGLIRRGKNAQEFVYGHFDVHKNIEIQLNKFAEILKRS